MQRDIMWIGARGCVVGWGTVLQAGYSRVRFLMRPLNFSIYLMLPPALWNLGSTQTLTEMRGRAIAQAVSSLLPITVARVRTRVWSSGICGALSTFSPSTSVSPANLHSTKFCILTITRGRYNKPELADVSSGPSLDHTPHYAPLPLGNRDVTPLPLSHHDMYRVIFPFPPVFRKEDPRRCFQK
jgi:hypothetical protein